MMGRDTPWGCQGCKPSGVCGLGARLLDRAVGSALSMLPQSSRQQVESGGALKSLRVWQWQGVGCEGGGAVGSPFVGLLGRLSEELDEDVGEGLAPGQVVEFRDLFADAGDAFLHPLVPAAEP